MVPAQLRVEFGNRQIQGIEKDVRRVRVQQTAESLMKPNHFEAMLAVLG